MDQAGVVAGGPVGHHAGPKVEVRFVDEASSVGGRLFAPDARMKKIFKEAAMVGDATARTINSRLRIKESYYYPNSDWHSGFYGG